MRLLSARIQHYRIHEDLRVDLDADIVLLHGPNESGKSTLAEALHHVLFLAAKGSGQSHQRLASLRGGTPEVELTLEAGGRRHTVRKRFGPSGTTVLESEGQTARQGNAAEEALAQLLQVGEAAAGRSAEKILDQRWAHLWVRQGDSHSSPTDRLEEAQGPLRERLQDLADIDLFQGPTDRALLEALATEVRDTFKDNGQPKKNSALQQLEDQREAAATALRKREATLAELRGAQEDLVQATADADRHAEAERATAEQRKALGKELARIEELRAQLTEKDRLLNDARQQKDAVREKDKQIRDLEKQIGALNEKAAPLRSKSAEREEQARLANTRAARARRTRESARRRAQDCRQRARALAAHAEVLQLDEQIREGEALHRAIDELQQEADALTPTLESLQSLHDDALAQLRGKELRVATASARLKAYGLQLSVETADRPLAWNGETLAPGETRTITDAGELTVGDGTRLRLAPGAADDLQQAREEHRRAEADYREELARLGVSDLADAEAKGRRRAELERQREELGGRIREKQARFPEDALTKARTQREEQVQRREARTPEDPPPLTFADSLPAAREAHEEAERATIEAEREEERTEAEAAAADADEEEAERLRKAAHQELEEQQQTLQTLTPQRDMLVKDHGDEAHRTAAIAKVEEGVRVHERAATALRQQLEELQPAVREQERERLDAALQSHRGNLDEASRRQGIARGQLLGHETDDPEREVREARAEYERRAARCERRRAEAERKQELLRLLREARRETTAALSRPLEERAVKYLRHLFPKGRIQLEWSEEGDSFKGFSLDRSGGAGSHLAFADLSHGTREQVGLALRLALAEILAASHDGALPVVLDDAFTHADRDRIEQLKNLLFTASREGLQILLLTCHPENYDQLGGREIALPAAPRRAPTADAPASPYANDSGPPGSSGTGGPAAESAPVASFSSPAPAPDDATADPSAEAIPSAETVPPAETDPSAQATPSAEATPFAEAASAPPGSQTPSPAAEPESTRPSPSDGPTPETFLSTLRQLGGQAGNQKLRTTLGCDEPTYHSLRHTLLQEGRIETGRGRGGTVRITHNPNQEPTEPA